MLARGTRSAAVGWRKFATRPYRAYQVLTLGQGGVVALAGDAITVPALLAIGASPAIVTAIAAITALGGVGQIFLPRLLHRTHGKLRLVTLVATAVGESRGLVLGVLFALSAGGVPLDVVLPLVAITLACAGLFSSVGLANQMTWFRVILPESERRFVAPRVSGMAMGIAAILLLPMALLVDVTGGGPAVYAGILFVGGLAGLLELAAVGRLRHPGKVTVTGQAQSGPIVRPAGWRRFVESMFLSGVAGGLTPYFSVFAISVLHFSSGFAILMSALGSGIALITATAVGAILLQGSSSRLLRLSMVLRAISVFVVLAAFPGNPLAATLLLSAVVLSSSGNAIGQISATERVFRLTEGGATIALSSQFVAVSSGSVGGAQIVAAGVITVGLAGYPVFALLLGLSGVIRLAAVRLIPVSESWTSQTGIFIVPSAR
jgi:hypothetical protein